MSVPPHLASAPNVNALWAALLVEELVRQGVGLFVVCPGSRSTPLAVAVAQNPRAEALVHWDERAAAFVALGWGRATGRPAAVITTSGTAVANLLPAAVEADADGVPLLLLTADRPPELRETGANQTIRQPPVFQDVARWALDWPVPTTDVSARWVLSTAAHAVHRARQPAGPVHLNLPFREPLAAVPDGTDVEAYLEDVHSWAEPLRHQVLDDGSYVGAPFVKQTRPRPSLDVDEPEAVVAPGLLAPVRPIERGVIVVGSLTAQEFNARPWWLNLFGVAESLGWPILPDVRSPFRSRGGGSYPLIPNVDLVLASTAFGERQRPDLVLHLGDRIVSKRLARFLSASRPLHYVQVTEAFQRQDPDGLVTDIVRLSVGRFVDALAQQVRQQPRRGGGWSWPRSWTRASEAVEDVLAGRLGRLSEPAVARAVTRPGTTLIVASSMPIRDVEAFAPTTGPGSCTVIANRGASGIDGTVATARGVALGIGKPVALLIGDLALLHDQTSLALLRDGPPVIVVVINNDGGGIFHRLPIAQGEGQLAPDVFEQMFGTPHGLGFADAARQFGLAYHAPGTMSEFEAAFEEAAASRQSALIEVRTDRQEQAALRRRLEAAAAAAVDAIGPPWWKLP